MIKNKILDIKIIFKIYLKILKIGQNNNFQKLFFKIVFKTVIKLPKISSFSCMYI